MVTYGTNTKRLRAFTLIEMIVVVVIIGLLSVALVPKITNIQARARDSKRKMDLNTVSIAVETYYNDNATYPSSAAGYYYSATKTLDWVPGIVPTYLPSLPTDPSNVILTGNFHTYMYHDPEFTGPGSTAYIVSPINKKKIYLLLTVLENSADPDTCLKRSYYVTVKRYAVPSYEAQWNMCDGGYPNYYYSQFSTMTHN